MTSGLYQLAPYASNAAESRGRFLAEDEAVGRTPFQRDRDRIIHSAAFRRLKHKTQVFVYHEGDHYRTRLTHSIEVAQVARTIARTLQLDEDLTEALALAHDLGHTPFGHAGEDALNDCMRRHGGFDHNAQSLRIVTHLEKRYARFDGLNLTWEALEGLVKHNGPLTGTDGKPVGRYLETGLPDAIADFATSHDLELSSHSSLEAQVAAISDDIAYNAHDIDDGLRAGLFEVIDLGDVPLVGTALGDVLGVYPELERTRLVHETVRRLISRMVSDVLDETRRRIAAAAPASAEAVRAHAGPLVGFSPQMAEDNRALKRFLHHRMYRHARVMDVMGRAKRVVRDLFEVFTSHADKLPPDWQGVEELDGRRGHARQVCDFIAGMTDRYALDQHKRLFDVDPLFR